MRKLINTALILILSGSVAFFISCTPGSCLEDTEAFVTTTFYNDTTKKLSPPDTLSMKGLNLDSLIYNKSLKTQPAYIPLNSLTDACTIIITVNSKSDTIIFRYSSYPHLISKECGYAFYHNLDTIPVHTNNFIKSITVTNSAITTSNVENIRIFY